MSKEYVRNDLGLFCILLVTEKVAYVGNNTLMQVLGELQRIFGCTQRLVIQVKQQMNW